MKAFVTGGAGFIGSHLVDRLLADGHDVTVYDRMLRGPRLLHDAMKSDRLEIIEGDLMDPGSMLMDGVDVVFHLAARADVRFSSEHPAAVFSQNVQGTFNVVEAARRNKVKTIVFASTGSIYGEPTVFPTPEDAPFPVQTSLYAASKLAGEGLIQAFAEGFGLQGFIFRFVSNVGERYTHGHIFDFYKKLKANPDTLDVLGDGNQRKSYVYVGDTVNGILTALRKSDRKINIFNLGTNDSCTVKESIGWITEYLNVKPALRYQGGTRGWSGDSPLIHLDCKRLRNLGWVPLVSIQTGIVRTVKYMQENHWLLERGEH
jgi:UDP-glucose 4-epimerase